MNAMTLIIVAMVGAVAGWITGALLLRNVSRLLPAAWGLLGATTTWVVIQWLDASGAGLLAAPLTIIAATAVGALLLSFAACVRIDSRQDRRRRHALVVPVSPEDSAKVRRALIQVLLSDATAQEAGHVEDIGRRASIVLAELAVAHQPVPEQIHTALSFWSGWIDARTNGWAQGEFQQMEGPARARGIAADLAKSSEIHDPAVVRLFAQRHARPFVEPA